MFNLYSCTIPFVPKLYRIRLLLFEVLCVLVIDHNSISHQDCAVVLLMMRLALYVDEDKYHHHLNMTGLEMTFIANAPVYNLIKTIQKVSPHPSPLP